MDEKGECIKREKIYQKTWFIVICLIVIFPVGIFLMWKYRKFNKVIRIIVSIAIIFIFGCFVFGSDTEVDYSRPLGDYDAGITYYDLARNPDDYENYLLVMEGTVVQTMESDEDVVELRVAVDDDYDDIVYLKIDRKIINTRILEDDNIKFYGISTGLITYESTENIDITIPSVTVEKFEIY